MKLTLLSDLSSSSHKLLFRVYPTLNLEILKLSSVPLGIKSSSSPHTHYPSLHLNKTVNMEKHKTVHNTFMKSKPFSAKRDREKRHGNEDVINISFHIICSPTFVSFNITKADIFFITLIYYY